MDIQLENEILRESNKILRKRQRYLMHELNNINEEKEDLEAAIVNKNDFIYDMQVRNENYLARIEELKERVKKLQNVIERLGGENG